MPHTAPISADPLARLAERQHWITPEAETAVQKAIRDVLGGDNAKGRKIRDLLHGTWLHEPLHSVMTDVPVGSWTAAVLFDAIAAIARSEKFDFAADALVILGLAGATGAAITGMSDWSEIKREAPRKVGAVHALLNVAATVIFAGSIYERRKKGSRPNARALAILGYLIVSASAHLGGNMIYEHGIGVERGKAWQD
ncbi:MAG: DUF2231 domain-containing protein [Janthinobacterium lividum]